MKTESWFGFFHQKQRSWWNWFRQLSKRLNVKVEKRQNESINSSPHMKRKMNSHWRFYGRYRNTKSVEDEHRLYRQGLRRNSVSQVEILRGTFSVWCSSFGILKSDVPGSSMEIEEMSKSHFDVCTYSSCIGKSKSPLVKADAIAIAMPPQSSWFLQDRNNEPNLAGRIWIMRDSSQRHAPGKKPSEWFSAIWRTWLVDENLLGSWNF